MKCIKLMHFIILNLMHFIILFLLFFTNIQIKGIWGLKCRKWAGGRIVGIAKVLISCTSFPNSPWFIHQYGVFDNKIHKIDRALAWSSPTWQRCSPMSSWAQLTSGLICRCVWLELPRRVAWSAGLFWQTARGVIAIQTDIDLPRETLRSLLSEVVDGR